MKNNNYVFLGVGIAYIVVAIIQAAAKGSLSITLYFTIAVISLQLTLLEMIKSILRQNKKDLQLHENFRRDYASLLKKKVAAFERYSSLKNEVDMSRAEIEKLSDNTPLKKQKETQKILTKITNALSILQIIICCIQIILIPIKHVPNNLTTMKTINILTLLSFSFVFLSYFISSFDFERNQKLEGIRIEESTSNYYLDTIEIINREEEQKNKNA